MTLAMVSANTMWIMRRSVPYSVCQLRLHSFGSFNSITGDAFSKILTLIDHTTEVLCQGIVAVVNIEIILYRHPFSPNKSKPDFCHYIVLSSIAVGGRGEGLVVDKTCCAGVVWEKRKRKRMERVKQILKPNDCKIRPQVLLYNIKWMDQEVGKSVCKSHLALCILRRARCFQMKTFPTRT